jgi:uncharacterized membrane protein YfcA
MCRADYNNLKYFIWIGLINVDMLMQGLMLLPALVLGFLAGSFVFGKVDEAYFRRLALAITLAAGILLLFIH